MCLLPDYTSRITFNIIFGFTYSFMVPAT
uniref:Uncharacterized protein n=1 Tax=Anguilla anguilla TaxID=7936 RepID=A0A0E9Q2U0_ANGAN